ncbi:MAG: glucosyltransferase domain-containing protein [Clostridia bacterium]|nr:glucosyltransferase domain-containing protein [Clostridia bacterium]
MKRLIEKNLGYLSDLRAELSGGEARNRLLYAMLGAVLFCIAAHGFAYFGFAPLHDAVNYVDYHSGNWEISLGRYLEPLYGKIRGTYTMPWLCGMFSMLYTGLAAFFISDLLEIRSRTLVMMLSGFLTVNATMIDTTLEYASFGDMFALSLMLAGAGAYMVIRVPGLLGAALSVCLFLGSLGLYQSYIFVAIQLMLQYALYQALRERKLLAKAGPVWLRMAAVLAVTLAAYVVLYKGAMRFYGVQAVPSSYNSPAALASMSVREMMEYVKAAYVNFAAYFYGYGRLERSAFNVLSLMMTAAAGVMLVWQIIKKRLPVINAAFISVVMALFPFLAQATSILTRSMEIYFLAAPGMMLLFPFLLGLIASPVLEGEALCLRSRCMRAAVTALCAALLFVGVRMSNGLYTYQRVQYDKTHSYVTRIMERIDTTPGYIPGETPVAFAGLLSSGLINLNPPEGAEWMSGLNRSGVTYMGIFESYFRLYGENIDVITDYTGLPDYAQLDEVRAMPAYPQAGCTRMIDGTLVVKLSQP